MKVLALDLATKTGVAFGSVGGKPFAQTVHLGASEYARYAKAQSMVHTLIDRLSPDLVVIEAPVGGPKTSQFLVGLIACVAGAAHGRGVPVKTYFPSTVRKHFLGKALTVRDFPSKSIAASKNALKQVVISKCHMLGWTVNDDNQADACALWEYACAMESRAHKVNVGPLFVGAKNG